MSDKKSELPVKNIPDTKRLPCRGCTADCKNYAFCDGKPWRQVHNGFNDGIKIH